MHQTPRKRRAPVSGYAMWLIYLLVLLALLGGFAIFFLRNFAQVLGENDQIPIVIAAWSPPIAAALLAVSLLLHLEDG